MTPPHAHDEGPAARLRVSVCIPTCQRPDKLAACLRRLARQTLDPGAYEVLVGVDGHDDHAQEVAADAWLGADGRPDRLVVRQCVKQGPNAVRNALVELAAGDTLVFLNDDVRPHEALVETHLAAQDDAEGAALVVGASPWVVRERDTLFDRLLRETSMVFFYDRMDDADPARDWGFRHAWTLNLSARTSLVRASGGFPVVPSVYGYDDLAFAWAFCTAHDAPVLYRPEAIVHHDHTMTPSEYLERERRLGESAWRYAQIMPAFADEVFRRRITSDDEIDAAREYLADYADTLPQLDAWFRSLADRPASEATPDEVQAAYAKHLPLKRARWRRGLLDAAAGPRRAVRSGTAA